MQKQVIRGSFYDIGYQLGVLGHTAWHQRLVSTALWQTVIAQQHSPLVHALAAQTEKEHPTIWQELLGLAAGLDAPFSQVFAWHCRGDLLPSTADGCTSIAGKNNLDYRLIAHNEDGLPILASDCFMVEVHPNHGVSYLSFAYPGSLCGHTFSVNQYGLVNVVNNIRAVERPIGMPRQILARAALNAKTLDQAIAILSQPRSGAFHHTLGQVGEPRLLSIEATAATTTVHTIATIFGHANHLVHPAQHCAQIITRSSAARQHRLATLLAVSPRLSESRLIAILSDQHDASLPIYRRSPSDPDQENTLATAVFMINKDHVAWSVYTQNRNEPSLQGIQRTGQPL